MAPRAAAARLLAVGMLAVAAADPNFPPLEAQSEGNSVTKVRNMFASDTLDLVIGSNTAEWDLRLSPIEDQEELVALGMPIRGENFNTDAHERLKEATSRLLFSRGLWFTLNGERYGDGHFPEMRSLKAGRKVEATEARDHYLGQFVAYETTWRIANKSDPMAANFKYTSSIKSYGNVGTIVFEQRFTGLGPDSDVSLPDALGDLELASRFTSSAFPRIFLDKADVGTSLTSERAGVGIVEFAGPFLAQSKAIPLDDLFTRKEFERGARWAGGPYCFFVPSLDISFVLSPASNFMVSSCLPGKQNARGFPDGVQEGPQLRALECGLMGSTNFDHPDAETSSSFSYILVYAPGGVNNALKRWANVMKRKTGQAQISKHHDPTLNRLGYGTDKGAFYYYHTEAGQSYNDVFRDLKRSFEAQKLPVHYALLDSWWYKQDPKGGLLSWEPRDNIFPRGFSGLREETQWFFQLHSKWFSPHNVYAANRVPLETEGAPMAPTLLGKAAHMAYEMHVEPLGTGPRGGGMTYDPRDPHDFDPLQGSTMALPMDKQFWTDFLTDAKQRYGMQVYEQDWLWNIHESMNVTLRSFDAADRFFRAMNDGARAAGVAIQFSMALPRHVLQSVTMSQVTQARASDNNHPGTANSCTYPFCAHYTGTSNILFGALGVSPSKDSYWSTASQCCNPAYCDTTPGLDGVAPVCSAATSSEEEFSELNSIISAYTMGPHTISDKIGHTNASLVRMAIEGNGWLLHPSRPMTATDRGVWQGLVSTVGLPNQYAVGPIAIPDAGGFPNQYPVQSSASFVTVHLPGGRVSIFYSWMHILTFGLAQDSDFIWNDLQKAERGGGSRGRAENPLMLRWRGHSAGESGASAIFDLGIFTPKQPLRLAACEFEDYGLYHLAPLFEENYALLGENTKWVPVSKQRIRGIERVNKEASGVAGLRVIASGAVGEKVELLFATPKAPANPQDAVFWAKSAIQVSDELTLGVYAMSCVIGATQFTKFIVHEGRCEPHQPPPAGRQYTDRWLVSTPPGAMT